MVFTASASAQVVMPTDLPPVDPPIIDPASNDPQNPHVIFYSGAGNPADVGVGPDGLPILPFVRNADGSVDDPLDNTANDPSIIFYAFGGNGLAAVAQTSNQLAVATTLDGLAGNSTPSINALIQVVNGLPTPARKRAALVGLGGEVYGSMQTIGVQVGDQMLRSVTQRLINSQSLLIGGDPWLAQRSAPRTDGSYAVVRQQSPTNMANGWVQGFGATGDVSGNGNAGDASYRLGGLSYGIDVAIDDSSIVGISGGQSWSGFSTGDFATGDVMSNQASIYAFRTVGESAYGLAVLQYGYHQFDVMRNVPIGPVLVTANSHMISQAFQAYGETGLNVEWSFLRWQPYLGIQYGLLANGKAFDQNGGPINLNVADTVTQTAFTHVGSRLIFRGWEDSGGRTMTPYLNARWMADLVGDSRTVPVALAGAPGANWTVSGTRPGRNLGVFGPGVAVQLASGVSLFASYDLQIADRYVSHAGSGGLIVEF